MNQTIFHSIYGLSKQKWASNVAYFLSYPFAVALMISVSYWVFFYKGLMMFMVVFLSIVTTWLLVKLLKIISNTKRPYHVLGFVPRVYPDSPLSFPSEHAALFTTLAVSMFVLSLPLGVVLCICALLIGLSRIVLGVHYPIDITWGMIVGACTTLVYISIFNSLWI